MEAADAPEVGKKGKSVVIRWMKSDLGVKLKNGKLSSKWYRKIKSIITRLVSASKDTKEL